MLEARHVNVHYGDTWAVQDVSFDLLEGQWMMLAGPNGAGKSTLIRAIAQTVPWEGSLRLDGENLREMKSMKRARLIGVLAQHNRAQYGYTVEEIVRLGRYAYRQGFLKGGGEDTEQAVEEALAARELIKINVLTNCLEDPRELAQVLAGRTRSQVVQVIGRKIILYREGKDEHKKIVLPPAGKK